MVGSLLGSVVGMAAAALAASVALAGHTLVSTPDPGIVSPFGGSMPVHIAHVGHIDVDLESSSSAGLHKVPCASGLQGIACFVAR